jgi:hypothetical protein
MEIRRLTANLGACLLLLCGIAQGQEPPIDPEASSIIATVDAELKYTYSGSEVTFSWTHCDPDVVFEIEVYKWSPTVPIRMAISTGFPALQYVWTPQQLGLYYVRVRAQNVLSIHGDELFSTWTTSHTMETDPPPTDPNCPVNTGRNFLIYAGLAPPTGGIE